MKKVIIILNLFLFLSGFSQQYENFYTLKQQWDSHFDSIINIRGIDSMQGTGYNPYKRWIDYWQPKLYPHGDYNIYKQGFLDYLNDCIENGGPEEDGYNQFEWELVGPKKMPEDGDLFDNSENDAKGLGQIHFIEFDPNDPTKSIMFACSPVGGLWRSTDKGENWTNAGTDKGMNLQCGVSSVAIDENNSANNWFISTGNGECMPNHEWWQKSIGVWRTLDGGNNWEYYGLNNIDRMRKIVKIPSLPGIAPLLVVTELGVYKCENALQTNPQWILIKEGNFYDIELHPVSATNLAYVSGTQSTTIWVINYQTNNTYPLPNLSFLPDPTESFDEQKRRITIEFSPAVPEYLFIVVSYNTMWNPALSNVWNSKLFRYNLLNNNYVDKGALPIQQGATVCNAGINNERGMGWTISPELYNGDLVMVHGNTAPVRMSTNLLDDLPCNWTNITSGYFSCEIHVDMHHMNFCDYPYLWVASDGGVYRTMPRNIPVNWEEKNNGLAVATCYYLGNSNLDPNVMVSGQHDCGSNLYYRVNETWYEKHVCGGDGYKCIITDDEPLTFYVSAQWGHIVKSTDYYTNSTNTHICSSDAWFNTFYENHPNNPDLIYSTNENGLYKNENCGGAIPWSNYGNIPTGQDTWTVAISKSNPDYIYTSWFDNDNSVTNYQRIYKSTTGGGPDEENWSLVGSPISPYDEWITSIAIDENNPDHIWVATNWKIFSVNSSTGVWEPYYSGIPAWNSIYKIVYVYGTMMDELYAGTAHGLYYINNELNEWINVSGNLPNVEITDIEINYSNNSINVATFGRGIWATSFSCSNNGNPLTINDVWKDWPGYYRIFNDVRIPYGNTLNITGEVEMGQGTKIIIEPGGKLILNGGTITNACEGLWQGIEVWGTSSAYQNPVEQGWVKIINGGTIENAVCGIRAVKMSIPQGDGEEAPDYFFTGGIIQASDAHFINNQTAVQFYDYSHSSVSYFVNCEFKVDWNYFGYVEPENYMVVDNMTGVRITFCEFLNAKTPTADYTGILSENSTILLEGDCVSGSPCNEEYYGIFENLEYGVYATAATTSRYADIRHTKFMNNYRGVYIGAMTSARVTSNKFSLNTPAIDQGYGLYLDRSTGYWVEDNIFEKTPGVGGTHPRGIGIVVNESGRNPNQIYLNVFNHVENAINVQGKNRHGKIETQGLVLKCNDYNETAFDETIIWDSPIGSSEAGIARKQGLGTGVIKDLANNIFYVPSEIPDGDFDDINNTSNRIDYYYSTNAGDFKVEPIDAQFFVTVWKYGTPTTPWTYEAACESNINPGGGGGTGIEDDRAAMDDAQEGIETTQAVLTAMIDGGDTEALNTEVESSTPPEALQVYNELMSESPNLSETVVESSIEKENVLPNAMVRDVMVANPHTAKSMVLMEKLDERFDPMPEYMKAQILAGQNIQTMKEELEAELGGYQLKKAIAMENIIRYYQEELELQAASDSIVALYQADNTLSSSYRLAWLYLERGEYQTGESVLNNIPAQYNLDEEEQLGYNEISAIYDMLADLYENGNTIDSLTGYQISQLHTLEAEGSLTAQAYARNILLALDEIEYDEPVLFPDFTKSSKAIEEYGKLINTKPPQMLEVYPNPSSGYVIIGYNLDTESDLSIEIKDVTGKAIQTLATNGKQDQLTVVTENWKPGVYIATLFIDGKSKESVKFTLVK